MAQAKLTKTLIERTAANGKEVLVWDTALPGFGVRIKPNGRRSYLVQYRDRSSGQSRRQTIGQHGVVTFDQARKKAKTLLGQAQQGGDPVNDRRAAREAMTFEDLAREYLIHHAKVKKRPSSWRNDEAMLNNILLPSFRTKRVADITRQQIQALHTSLQDRPYQANRVLALLSKMFSLAQDWGIRADHPVKRIPRYYEERRERLLSDEELKRLLIALDTHPNRLAANAFRLQLLTGARIGEVLQARWQDIDLQRGVWTKPSHHTKQKKTEHIPLSSAALELLKDMSRERTAGQAFLFPSRIPGQPIRHLKKAWKAICQAAKLEDYRIHDNRHTYASVLAMEGISLVMIGRLLGHTNPTTTQRYAHLADAPLREATEQIGRRFQVAPK